jgi:hypothetical protein
VRALLITGRLGSGKTAVAVEAAHRLESRGVRCAALDLDWLCWVGPDLESGELTALLARNLRDVSANLAAVGVTHVLMARALMSRGDRTAVDDALPTGSALTVVRLDVDAATVRARLGARDSGSEAEHVAPVADAVARAVETAGVEDHVVSNAGRSLRATADAVLDLWLGGRGSGSLAP